MKVLVNLLFPIRREYNRLRGTCKSKRVFILKYLFNKRWWVNEVYKISKIATRKKNLNNEYVIELIKKNKDLRKKLKEVKEWHITKNH